MHYICSLSVKRILLRSSILSELSRGGNENSEKICPGGASENSPTFQPWDCAVPFISPEATAEYRLRIANKLLCLFAPLRLKNQHPICWNACSRMPISSIRASIRFRIAGGSLEKAASNRV